MRTPRRRLSLAAAVVLSGASVSAGTSSIILSSRSSTPRTVTQLVSATPIAATTSGTLTPEEVYRRSKSALVSITARSTQTTQTPFGAQSAQQIATGSGFVVSADGFIVTNAHVVSGASTVRTKVGGGNSVPARIVGTDLTTDLALLKVETGSGPLSPLELGDSATAEVGDAVYALGDPYRLERTLTAGVISAIHRSIASPASYGIPNAIQTDAALNPGNSGGPLLDTHGRVIGVNSQIESSGSSGTGTASGNTGVGFAIPSNTVKRVIAQLEKSGHATHAYLGVSLEDATGAVQGALVGDVKPGGPGERASLQRGDVITRAGNAAVTSSEELSSALDALAPGDRIALQVRRGAQTRSITVTLGTRPNGPGSP
ncbi:MAG: hypothetical protein QOK31_61 [Solirubrobacteraceae bacterium]|jgi:putative serine protease PepD|nr:hypothetical protein [Solirubrobacteraceae bacterium]